MITLDKKVRKKIESIQREEITAYHIYCNLAKREKSSHNKEILSNIAKDELGHYNDFKKLTEIDVKPSRLQIFFYSFLSFIFGLTFSLKLMERLEAKTSIDYSKLEQHYPGIVKIIEEEEAHEKILLDLIDEKKLNYIGSIVLGLNDALVELTGALAGFTFAIQNSRTIALMGLITGIAATFSMAASEYLSQRQETGRSVALRSSLYTGLTYAITVVFLITPYFLIQNPFVNLGVMISIVIVIIFVFNFYISVAKDLSFIRRFLEMAGISVGVALLSFGIGWIVRTFLGLDI